MRERAVLFAGLLWPVGIEVSQAAWTAHSRSREGQDLKECPWDVKLIWGHPTWSAMRGGTPASFISGYFVTARSRLPEFEQRIQSRRRAPAPGLDAGVRV